jgi:type I restriction enzyme M protein
MLLPGEENIVLTKEFFIFRVTEKGRKKGWDHFYLIWALLLKPVRDQWKRIVLMQTNREDCGNRYREILLPQPINKQWAKEKSEIFRTYFLSLAKANEAMYRKVRSGDLSYIASVAPPEFAPTHENDN